MTDKVNERIRTLFESADKRDWKQIQSIMDSKVLLDYTSLTGGQPSLLSPQEITTSWANFLPGFDRTHHKLSGFSISESEGLTKVTFNGSADHFLDGAVWIVEGNYEAIVQQNFKISSLKFNLEKIDGDASLPKKALINVNLKQMKKVTFISEGLTLVGNLFLPDNFENNKKYPAIVVSGSWTTVKEQMAGLYAQRLAREGFIALAFDFRNFGESQGEPRFYESPMNKRVDVKNAITFLASLPEVDAEKIGAFGVCAGAMYTLMAAAEDTRIKSVVTTASWLHDSEAVKIFYGGEEGVQAKVKAAQQAKKKFQESGICDYIPAISETDPNAAMYGPYDYYLNPKRGAIPQWSADKFAVMTWEDWLTANPMPYAKKLKAPTLMIHSDGAVLPDYTKTFFNDLVASDKKLHWIKTELQSPFHQFSFYDQEAEVSESVKEASEWFKEKLS